MHQQLSPSLNENWKNGTHVCKLSARINIGNQIKRWMTLKAGMRLWRNEDVAKMLMDCWSSVYGIMLDDGSELPAEASDTEVQSNEPDDYCVTDEIPLEEDLPIWERPLEDWEISTSSLKNPNGDFCPSFSTTRSLKNSNHDVVNSVSTSLKNSNRDGVNSVSTSLKSTSQDAVNSVSTTLKNSSHVVSRVTTSLKTSNHDVVSCVSTSLKSVYCASTPTMTVNADIKSSVHQNTIQTLKHSDSHQRLLAIPKVDNQVVQIQKAQGKPQTASLRTLLTEKTVPCLPKTNKHLLLVPDTVGMPMLLLLPDGKLVPAESCKNSCDITASISQTKKDNIFTPFTSTTAHHFITSKSGRSSVTSNTSVSQYCNIGQTPSTVVGNVPKSLNQTVRLSNVNTCSLSHHDKRKQALHSRIVTSSVLCKNIKQEEDIRDKVKSDTQISDTENRDICGSQELMKQGVESNLGNQQVVKPVSRCIHGNKLDASQTNNNKQDVNQIRSSIHGNKPDLKQIQSSKHDSQQRNVIQIFRSDNDGGAVDSDLVLNMYCSTDEDADDEGDETKTGSKLEVSLTKRKLIKTERKQAKRKHTACVSSDTDVTPNCVKQHLEPHTTTSYRSERLRKRAKISFTELLKGNVVFKKGRNGEVYAQERGETSSETEYIGKPDLSKDKHQADVKNRKMKPDIKSHITNSNVNVCDNISDDVVLSSRTDSEEDVDIETKNNSCNDLEDFQYVVHFPT